MLDTSKLDERTLNEFNSLSDEERKIFIQVLEEYSKLGIYNTLDSLYQEDFKEVPVDIITFIKEEYLNYFQLMLIHLVIMSFCLVLVV